MRKTQRHLTYGEQGWSVDLMQPACIGSQYIRRHILVSMKEGYLHCFVMYRTRIGVLNTTTLRYAYSHDLTYCVPGSGAA